MQRGIQLVWNMMRQVKLSPTLDYLGVSIIDLLRSNEKERNAWQRTSS